MTLEETTELYASVLRQLLPVGGYDASPNTEALAVDVYAHAKLLAHADLDAKRLLNVLEGIPSELIAEYETEYGLPLKCTVNASRTVEERLQILNWVRTSRNVLNRAYLEHLLAIFGVVLIDIVKFKPLLCTAACDSPVNTEQLRYKVFLRLQYPMNADMSCIVENYLPGYLRIEWMIDMPWGDWIVNSGVTVNANGIAHYTAYKTNQRDYYDSHANLDLTAAIVRSLHDVDMQQWQAVKDAANELFGQHSGWSINAADQTITSIVNNTPIPYYSLSAYTFGNIETTSMQESCRLYVQKSNETDQSFRYVYSSVQKIDASTWTCNFKLYWADGAYLNTTSSGGSVTIKSPNLIAKTISIITLASKIISNASSSNQAISLLAEAFLEAVATSIYNADESKQFVKLSDLITQFELNKTLRT